MSRLAIPSVENSPIDSIPLLNAVHQQLGVVPNLMKLIGNSPAALEGYLSLNAALAKGKLKVGLRERIALAIAEYNGCAYCLSAHAYLGENMAKLSAAEMEDARNAYAAEPAEHAALQFARRVASQQGRVSDADVKSLHLAGFDDASIVEIVCNVALNVLTNYINNVGQTTIDFPEVLPKAA
jgi:uncharacterized peroxidase-related enzyme